MGRCFERLRERLHCLVHGHRDLAGAPAYAEVLAGRFDRELYYCGACGAPVWIPVRRDEHLPPSWTDTGLAGI